MLAQVCTASKRGLAQRVEYFFFAVHTVYKKRV